MNQKIIISNNIKVLLYNIVPTLLEKLDLDNDDIFLEPMLFAYFNSKLNINHPPEMIIEIMQGYISNQREVNIKYLYNRDNIAYLPNLGYFKKGETEPFEQILFIENTSIQILKYPIKLLETIFRNTFEELIPFSKIEISNKLLERNIKALTKAFNLIKYNSKEHYNLIEGCCKYCIIFKTNPNNTNSFATINAHGIAFFNVYQDDYDEVFFVDDIAHQTGHIILTTLFFERKRIFIIDESKNIGEILNTNDYRSFYTLFHALYTYYTSLVCLNDCLINYSFNSKQELEAKGRVGFYLSKFKLDLNNFENVIKHYKGIDNVLAESGISLYLQIRNKYFEIFNTWNSIVMKFDYSNQKYNFAFKNFLELNK